MAEEESAQREVHLLVGDLQEASDIANTSVDDVEIENELAKVTELSEERTSDSDGGSRLEVEETDPTLTLCRPTQNARTLSVSLTNIYGKSRTDSVSRNVFQLSRSLPDCSDIRVSDHPDHDFRERTDLGSRIQPEMTQTDTSSEQNIPSNTLSSENIPVNPLNATQEEVRVPISVPADPVLHRLSITSLLLSQVTNKRNKTCICRHRTSLPREGPPCYNCSTCDMPPEYYKIDESGLKRARSRLLHLYRNLVFKPPRQISASTTPPPLPPDIEWSSPPFTINLHSQQPHDDGPTDEGRAGEHLAGHEHSYLQPQRRYSHANDIPPPYSPPTPASLMAGQSQPDLPDDFFLSLYRNPLVEEREQVQITYHQGYCNRSCHCNFVYSLLLAIIVSVSLLGPDQPLIILMSSVFFLTVFLFMPVVWILECLIRWKINGNCPNIRAAGIGSVSPVAVL